MQVRALRDEAHAAICDSHDHRRFTGCASIEDKRLRIVTLKYKPLAGKWAASPFVSSAIAALRRVESNGDASSMVVSLP